MQLDGCDSDLWGILHPNKFLKQVYQKKMFSQKSAKEDRTVCPSQVLRQQQLKSPCSYLNHLIFFHINVSARKMLARFNQRSEFCMEALILAQLMTFYFRHHLSLNIKNEFHFYVQSGFISAIHLPNYFTHRHWWRSSRRSWCLLALSVTKLSHLDGMSNDT